MTIVASAAATAVVPSTLWAIGATLPAGRPTSWIPPGLSGQLAASCYVLTSDGQALIIDTGLGAHWDVIRDCLDRLLASVLTRSLIMTRREPDAIGNLPAMVGRYGLQTVYCGGVISPVDFFERVDVMSAALSLRAIAQTDVTWVHPGTGVRFGALEVEVLPTTLRVLPKNHLYESATGTLFASDTWVLLPQSSHGPVETVRTFDERLSVERIADDLRHRFEWLVGIDTGPMQEEIAGLIETRRVDRICPSYGCVIEGRALVDIVLRNTLSALASLSSQARISRLTRFRAERVGDAP